MSAHQATLPPAFSLLNSEFNDFLFAPIGEEGNDTLLTVLSALARLGIDPWQESARLAQLSTELATQRLTSIIAELPNGRWAPADADAIAARLVNLLPAKRPSVVPSPGVASGQLPAPSRLMLFLIMATVGGLTMFALSNLGRPAAVIGTENPSPAATSAPQVPVAGTN